jgi:hypothetical protein
MLGSTNPLPFVILNEVKNLAPRVLGWDSVKARERARSEILHFVQNDKAGGVAFLLHTDFPIARCQTNQGAINHAPTPQSKLNSATGAM